MKQAVIMGAGVGLCMALASQDLAGPKSDGAASAQVDGQEIASLEGFCEDGSVCHSHGDMVHSHDATFHSHGDLMHSHETLRHAHGDLVHEHPPTQVGGLTEPHSHHDRSRAAASLPDEAPQNFSGDTAEGARIAPGAFSPLRSAPSSEPTSLSALTDIVHVIPNGPTVWGAEIARYAEAPVPEEMPGDAAGASSIAVVHSTSPDATSAGGDATGDAIAARTPGHTPDVAADPTRDAVASADGVVPPSSGELPASLPLDNAGETFSALADALERENAPQTEDLAEAPALTSDEPSETLGLIPEATLASLFALAYGAGGEGGSDVYETMLLLRLFDAGLGGGDRLEGGLLPSDAGFDAAGGFPSIEAAGAGSSSGGVELLGGPEPSTPLDLSEALAFAALAGSEPANGLPASPAVTSASAGGAAGLGDSVGVFGGSSAPTSDTGGSLTVALSGAPFGIGVGSVGSAVTRTSNSRSSGPGTAADDRDARTAAVLASAFFNRGSGSGAFFSNSGSSSALAEAPSGGDTAIGGGLSSGGGDVVTAAPAIPLPAPLVLLAGAIGSLVFLRRFRRAAAA